MLGKASPLFVLLLLLGTLVFGGVSYAQPIPPTCEPDYYEVLKARGWLEGKREMEMAQRIILKADSVLEYSCFHLDVDYVGYIGGFSETHLTTAVVPPEFDGGIGIYANSLETKLDFVVYETLLQYLWPFRHYYGGGVYDSIPVGGFCNPMNVVWHVAKCENFDPYTWLTFDVWEANDIRVYPWPCTPYDTDRPTRIADNRRIAYPPPAAPPALGGMHAVNGYIDYISNCGSAQPIPTGVVAEFTHESGNGNPTDVPDAVCLPPGCSYTGPGGSCN